MKRKLIRKKQLKEKAQTFNKKAKAGIKKHRCMFCKKLVSVGHEHHFETFMPTIGLLNPFFRYAQVRVVDVTKKGKQR